MTPVDTRSAAPPAALAGRSRVLHWLRGPAQSGPAVARLFHRALALVQLIAWLSLAVQLPLLIGERGLLPARELFTLAAARGLGFFELPSVLWLAHGEGALWACAIGGVALSLLSLAGLLPRAAHALNALLYLSYAVAGQDFTAFQWDNLLVEASLLAAFLPLDRPAPLAHFALRALLFKLYFQSGIAKWQSQLGDWHDGSAMTFYYETAPLPARLAHLAHSLPERFHHLESYGALVLELLFPLFVWAPRPLRLCAFFAFTGFQIANTATANYGFFTYLSCTLHLFLLRDADLPRLVRGEPLALAPAAPSQPALRSWLARGLLGAWLLLSLNAGLLRFGLADAAPRALVRLDALQRPLRAANVYHLFGHITRERIEPQLEIADGQRVREHDLRYKPGATTRAPPYVAPHQPRVDFRLWFYGLGFRAGTPRYVDTLLDRLCHDPEAVQALFVRPLPRRPSAVRIVFYRYRFTSRAELRSGDGYWKRERLGALPARTCREHQTGVESLGEELLGPGNRGRP